MKLKSINGKVPYVMAAGKDFPNFPICVDDKFYFAGTSTKPKSSKSKTPCEG